MRFFAWIIIGIVGISALGGCGPRGEQVMIQNAKSSDYSTGYGDGCESGRADAGSVTSMAQKDGEKYQNSSQYKEGWDTGFKECKFRELQVSKLSEKERKKPVRF